MLTAHPLVAIGSSRTASGVFMASLNLALALWHRMRILPPKDVKCPFQCGQTAMCDVKPSTVLAVVSKLVRHIICKLLCILFALLIAFLVG